MFKKLALAALVIGLSVMVLRFELVSASLFLELSGWIKARYLAGVETTQDFVDTYFEQAETIETLLAQNRQLKEERETLSAFAAEVIALSRLKNYEAPAGFRVKTVRALSYAALPDMQKILVGYDALGENEVRGLIYNNQTAGIVVKQLGSQAKALLNGDAKCSYAVFLGQNQVPGIAMGKSDQEMIVRYIPAWMNVNEGDEVVTSGLDGIFFAGVKVGTVIKVHRLNAYIEATIKPYYNSFNPDYFYLVEATR